VPPLSPYLAEAIRARRLMAGLTQEEVAERSGLHETYISMVERSVRNVTVEALERIANAIGVPSSRILLDAEAARAKKRR
jgi:transcriptional regulator with XRE-family HTH domain